MLIPQMSNPHCPLFHLLANSLSWRLLSHTGVKYMQVQPKFVDKLYISCLSTLRNVLYIDWDAIPAVSSMWLTYPIFLKGRRSYRRNILSVRKRSPFQSWQLIGFSFVRRMLTCCKDHGRRKWQRSICFFLLSCFDRELVSHLVWKNMCIADILGDYNSWTAVGNLTRQPHKRVVFTVCSLSQWTFPVVGHLVPNDPCVHPVTLSILRGRSQHISDMSSTSW